MARFVLIHGACHGAWCWRHVVQRLTASGHEVNAIDLPGHGDDSTPAKDVTLGDYVSRTVGALEADTILVGHSLGGLPITMAAAEKPRLVRALVYVCAFVPPAGQRFLDFRQGAVAPALDAAMQRRGHVSYPDPETSTELFYHDCSEEDRRFATKALSPQPVRVMEEVLEFTPNDLPKFYVRCLNDRIVLPEYQARVTQNWPEGRVFDMDTGHSPFFADPDGLARHLGAIARQTEDTGPD